MKKSNYKLPGLPSVSSVPKSTAKAPSAKEAGLSKVAGFNEARTSPLNFGRASRAATKTNQSTSSSTSQWSNLLSASTSGGLASTLSGAAGFTGGIGSIISGIENLFGGGKSAPPALVAYQLPTSQQQAISIGSSSTIPGIYGGPSSSTPFESQSSQIIQTVKQALLNSSSLNDVIAEI
jgi:hypothetical protein